MWGINIINCKETQVGVFTKTQPGNCSNKSQSNQGTSQSITMETLETKERGKPLLLGVKLDAAVQEYVQSLREANGVVMAAAEGIISARNISKLSSQGGHIVITKAGLDCC